MQVLFPPKKTNVSNLWTISTLFTLLLLASYRLIFKTSFKESGDWEAPATVLGWLYKLNFISSDFLFSKTTYTVLTVGFFLSILIWLLHRRSRQISLFFVFVFYSLACSIHLENIPRASSHTGNMISLALIIMFFNHLWGDTEILRINLKSFAQKQTTHSIIPWTLRSILYSIYTVSGLYKVFRSGIDWTNATNIQTYVHYFTSNDNILSNLILSNASIATIAGYGVLGLEVFAILGIFNEKIATTISVLFITFHLAISYMFGWTFYSHTIILFLTLPIVVRSFERFNRDKNSPHG